MLNISYIKYTCITCRNPFKKKHTLNSSTCDMMAIEISKGNILGELPFMVLFLKGSEKNMTKMESLWTLKLLLFLYRNESRDLCNLYSD